MTRERGHAPESRPVALTIAGSDSGGGAGIQADLKTLEAHGAFGTSVITAITAQNTRGVERSHVLPVREIEAQYDAVLSDFDVRAVKTGMLAVEEVVSAVADRLADYDGPVVVDPVMVAATGDRLLAPEAEDAYEELIAAATLVTPNADEAEVLTGATVRDETDAVAAAEAIVDMGTDAALVKGGHLDGERVVDVLVVGADGGGGAGGRDGENESDDEPAVHRFEHPRVDTDATHGSGCALSSAIAARLADGADLVAAVGTGTAFMERAVRYGHDVGEGPGAVHHLVDLREEAARHRAIEAVEGLVERFVARDVSRLVPEVGMNVGGATPYAERTSQVAAVEGRITRTLSGVRPTRGVRLGASGHVARLLLAAREHNPDYRFAVNCRFDEDVEAAIDRLSGPVVEVDRTAEPPGRAAEEGSTMSWVIDRAIERSEAPPVAVFDRGAVGKEPMLRLLATDAATLGERVFALLDGVE